MGMKNNKAWRLSLQVLWQPEANGLEVILHTEWAGCEWYLEYIAYIMVAGDTVQEQCFAAFFSRW